MKAELLLRERRVLSETAFVEVVIWRLPTPMEGSSHALKYRLAPVSQGVCVLRYDNETGKGKHKHVEERQVPYHFTDLQTLQTGFWTDVETWSKAQ
jgi:hypothetical protein